MDTLQENTVSSLDMGLTVRDSLDILEKVLEIVLPNIALSSVSVKGVEVRVLPHLGPDVGAQSLHGYTTTRYSKIKKRYISVIKLNNYSLRNPDNLIATFLHELAHTLTTPNTGDVMNDSMDRCGGHYDIFFETNCMLISFFKLDTRSLAIMTDPNSNTYIPTRYVRYHYHNVERPMGTTPPRPPISGSTPMKSGLAKRAKIAGRVVFDKVCRVLTFGGDPQD
jgi:hypothetical protein